MTDILIPPHPSLTRLVDVLGNTPTKIDNGAGCRPNVVRPIEDASQALVGRPVSCGGPCRVVDMTATTTWSLKVPRGAFAAQVLVTVMACLTEGVWSVKAASTADSGGQTATIRITPSQSNIDAQAYELLIGFGAGAGSDVGVTDITVTFTKISGSGTCRAFFVGVEQQPMTVISV